MGLNRPLIRTSFEGTPRQVGVGFIGPRRRVGRLLLTSTVGTVVSSRLELLVQDDSGLNPELASHTSDTSAAYRGAGRLGARGVYAL